MAEIALSRGMVALVDDVDVPVLSRHKWTASIHGSGRVYASRNVERGGKTVRIFMHHVILSPRSGEVIDHKNGNSLDNRRENLRSCSRSENVLNSSRAHDRGAFFDTHTGRWFARISHDGKRIFLGRYDTQEEARAAVVRARAERGIVTAFE